MITVLTVAGTSIRPETAVTTVDEDSFLNARIQHFIALENGFIVLSATDVPVGGNLNPDATGNQKFAINDATVQGIVSTLQSTTLRAYLVDGTVVLQRCGSIVINSPVPVDSFYDVQLNSQEWNSDKTNVDPNSGTITGLCTLNSTRRLPITLCRSTNKPNVGDVLTNLLSPAYARSYEPFVLNYTSLTTNANYWLVTFHTDSNNQDICDVVWDYNLTTGTGA